MATSSILALIAGLALGLLGLALVRRSWIRRQGSHLYLMIAGWVLMLASVWPFVLALGPDLGVTAAFIAPMLGAMGVMIRGMTRPVAAPALRTALVSTEASRPRWLASLRTLSVAALAGPVSLGVTLIASIALFRLTQSLSWDMADSLFTALVVAPLAWAGLAVVCALEAPLRWRTAALIGLSLVFALIALALPPSVS
ncbi:hypothetical protein [Oceanicaulis sp.]|uniref:hypothetical protein n=1 Tax=Oceanicaulis sp. TaxID=1924941 RepID=UPI003BAAF50D